MPTLVSTGLDKQKFAAIFCVFKPKFGLQLSSSDVFKEFETHQLKKVWRKLESPAGKFAHTKAKVGIKMKNTPDSAFPRKKIVTISERVQILGIFSPKTILMLMVGLKKLG